MDSYSESSSFLNLLNSQEPNTQRPNQYVTCSPTIEIGSSDLPVFSTQWSDDPNVDAHTVDDRKERRKWSPTEDVVLISAWLNTSKDPIVGNEQKAAAFWKRIAAYFATSPKLVGLQKREPNHCKQRWGKINEDVCKFVGRYDAATKAQSSGQNENDVMKMAHALFFNDYKVKFTLEHAWRVLRHDQKWCGSLSTKDNERSKRRKCGDQSTQSSTSVPGSNGADEEIARPLGVKAAKAKAKRALTKATPGEEEVKTLLNFHSIWEIKQKEFAMKDKLSKQKLLDSLLAKTEPLSEIDMALKIKLVNEILAS